MLTTRSRAFAAQGSAAVKSSLDRFLAQSPGHLLGMEGREGGGGGGATSSGGSPSGARHDDFHRSARVTALVTAANNASRSGAPAPSASPPMGLSSPAGSSEGGYMAEAAETAATAVADLEDAMNTPPDSPAGLQARVEARAHHLSTLTRELRGLHVGDAAPEPRRQGRGESRSASAGGGAAGPQRPVPTSFPSSLRQSPDKARRLSPAAAAASPSAAEYASATRYGPSPTTPATTAPRTPVRATADAALAPLSPQARAAAEAASATARSVAGPVPAAQASPQVGPNPPGVMSPIYGVPSMSAAYAMAYGAMAPGSAGGDGLLGQAAVRDAAGGAEDAGRAGGGGNGLGRGVPGPDAAAWTGQAWNDQAWMGQAGMGDPYAFSMGAAPDLGAPMFHMYNMMGHGAPFMGAAPVQGGGGGGPSRPNQRVGPRMRAAAATFGSPTRPFPSRPSSEGGRDGKKRRSGGGGGSGGGGCKRAVAREVQEEGDTGPLSDIEGCVCALSKDQAGCRKLQRHLEASGADAVSLILAEGLPQLGAWMVDPFGNYLFQKLLMHASAEERTRVLEAVGPAVVTAATGLHGTRSVQRLVELCTTPQQVEALSAVLAPHVISLATDANGNHVLQRCLQVMPSGSSAFIVAAITENCSSVSRHRHGCCVVQRCTDVVVGERREALVREVRCRCWGERRG